MYTTLKRSRVMGVECEVKAVGEISVAVSQHWQVFRNKGLILTKN